MNNNKNQAKREDDQEGRIKMGKRPGKESF